MKKGFLLFLLVTSFLYTPAQKTDQKLEQKINELVRGFRGETGIYVLHLPTGKTASYHADTIFPTASMVKIPILLGVMDKIRKGELEYHQEFIYRDSLLYSGSDILGSFRQDEKIELAKLLMLMLTTSDNTASLWLQSIAGSGSRINAILDSIGMVYTRVNSRTPGREKYRDLYGWGQTTPREMAALMENIYQGKIFNRFYSDWMIRLLGRNYWDEEALSQIPPAVFVASKNGAVDRSRSETILVMAPHGPYIFSILTKNQTDTTWNPENEGWVLARKLSILLWKYYEPKSSWKPGISVYGKPEIF
jgi:beta-lactamase class A